MSSQGAITAAEAAPCILVRVDEDIDAILPGL
jgi:hypothetical protein